MRHIAAVVLSMIGVVGSAWAQDAEIRSGHYVLEEDAEVESCGGFFWQCLDRRLSGELWLEVDAGSDSGRIVESDLSIWEPPPNDPPSFPFPADVHDLPLESLQGTLLDSETLELVSPAGSRQTARLTLTATADGVTLDGTYDEGCCDRYVHTFVDVGLERSPDPLPGDDVLLLHDGRFEVAVTWLDHSGATGFGRVAGSDPDDVTSAVASPSSGVLWFFTPDNWEMLVKVLNGCGVNGHYWVLASAATDVGFELTVSDTATGQLTTYEHELGAPAPAVTDIAAFAACP